MVPHGQSVVATAPAAFRFTYASDPARHEAAGRLLTSSGTAGGWSSGRAAGGRDALPAAIVELSRDVGIPNGIGGFGYREADIEGLVAGTLKQQRLLAIAPRQAGPDDLAGIFRESMLKW